MKANNDIYDKIERGIWDVEIGLDSLYCTGGLEPDEIAAVAEDLLEDATRLRKRVLRLLKDARSNG